MRLVAFSLLLHWVAWSPAAIADSNTDAPMVRQLSVGPIATPPVIDGDLDDQCWRQAAMASGFVTIEGEWAWEQTTAYLGYDRTHLYIAFSCNARSPDTLAVATKKNDDARVSSDDSVEIYLDTNHDRTTYYHFIINAIGTRYDDHTLDADKHIKDLGWNPEVELETRIHRRSWTVEMRVAFTSLGTRCPEAGEAWGLNLNRTRSPHQEATTNTPHSSWSGLDNHFNRPAHFGNLVFGFPPDVSYALAGMTGNELSVRVRNGNDVGRAVQVEWSAPDGMPGKRSSTARARLGPHEEKEIRMVYDAHRWGTQDTDERDTVPMRLTLRNPGNQEIFESTEALFRVEPAFFSYFSMSMDRYYYTPEDERLQVIVTPKVESGVRFDIAIRNPAGGDPLATRQIPLTGIHDEHGVVFDTTDWAPGRYVVTAHLRDDVGETLHSMHRVFIRKAIRPANVSPPDPKISIRPDGILLLDDEPFCPFFVGGVASQSPLCRDCFNVNFGGFAVTSRPLERLEVGLPDWTRVPGEVFRLLPEPEALQANVREVVTASKSNPLLLYWFMSYEAQIPMYRGRINRVRLDNVETLRKTSRFVKSIDPDHLTAIHVDRGPWAQYRDVVDVLEVAFPASSYGRKLIPPMIRHVDEVRAALDGMPFLFWIGASLPHPRTAEEIRGASYLALMHGAAGIVFHMGHGGTDPSFTRHWSVYTGLSREIETLFPLVTSPEPTDRQEIDVQPAEVIDYCVRRHQNRMYLIAVNTSDRLVEATISIGHETAILQPIDVLFENRALTPEGNRVNDTFTFFEPHVYALPLNDDTD